MQSSYQTESIACEAIHIFSKTVVFAVHIYMSGKIWNAGLGFYLSKKCSLN